jgi:hypothetical protein
MRGPESVVFGSSPDDAGLGKALLQVIADHFKGELQRLNGIHAAGISDLFVSGAEDLVGSDVEILVMFFGETNPHSYFAGIGLQDSFCYHLS